MSVRKWKKIAKRTFGKRNVWVHGKTCRVRIGKGAPWILWRF